METYSSTSSRKGKVPQRKYPMSLKVGTKKTCRLKYNMTKTHSELFVWSESELVDVKTPTIEKGEGGAPGILVMEVSANTHPAEDTAFVFVSDKMKPHTSYYCDALEFNLTTTGEDGALPPAQDAMQPHSPSALSAVPPAAPGEGDNLLQTRMLNTAMPVTPTHNHTASVTQGGRQRTAEDVLIDVQNALGVSSTVSDDVIKALSERVLALEKTTSEKLEAAKEATEKAQKLALETIEAATKDDADVKGDGDDGKRPNIATNLGIAGIAQLKLDMHDKLEEAKERLLPLDERMELEGYQWDLCVVLPEDAANPGQLTKEGASIVEKLDKEAFEILCFRSVMQPEPTAEELAANPKKKKPKNPKPGKGTIYCLLRLPLNNLREIADSQNYSMELDPDELKKRMLEGFVLQGVGGNRGKYSHEALVDSLNDANPDPVKCVYPRIYLELDKENYEEESAKIKKIEEINEIDFEMRSAEQQAQIQSLRVLFHAPYITPWEPFNYIFGQYEGDVDEKLYHKLGPSYPHPFDDVARINIQYAFIGEIKFLSGFADKKGKLCKGLSMQGCIDHGHVLTFFPLHNRTERDKLKQRWKKSFAYPFRNRTIVPFPWRIHQEPVTGRRQEEFDPETGQAIEPLDDKGKPLVSYEMDELMRKYFGEKLCLYMAFQTHYGSWLQLAAFLGLCHSFELIGAGATCDQEDAEMGLDDAESSCTPFVSPGLFGFAIIMNIWAVVMLEYWKRTENVLACRWGTTSFEEEEVDRPEFLGEDLWDWESTGKKRRYFADNNKIKGDDPEVYNRGFLKGSGAKASRTQFSFVVTTSLFVSVLGLVLTCFYIRMVLVTTDWAGIGFTYGKLIGSMMNAGQITVMEVVYEKVARWLNDRENHRTDTEYEDALIAKTFRFTIVNSYSSLYYLAFLQQHIDKDVDEAAGLACVGVECMRMMVQALFIVMLTKMGSSFKPLAFKMKKKLFNKTEEKNEVKASDPEIERQWQEYDMIHNSIKDYNELAQQFGYTMLFVVAAPWTPIVAWIGQILKTRIDSHKVIYDIRRPVPKKARDIGMWQTIFTFVIVMSIVTNAMLIVFVLDGSGAENEAGKVWVFNAIQYVLFSLMVVTQMVIDDEPFKMQVQLSRQETIVGSYILGIADEDEEAMEDDDEPMVIHENWMSAAGGKGLVRRTLPKSAAGGAEAGEGDGEGKGEGTPLNESEGAEEGASDPKEGEAKSE
mmetsp:Transcript_99871/g.285509  ORF Transcript_99871/g.285509 Transcript_99871/m.285509 type:complete len:1215 (+) Transcript_99871:241-3885(+)|eukprot:CAMPEP_0119481470 /NCGR_PEP_ID=MMETSP1344-20130328/9795_1 /TAXON_ID=236787 /ORGANISM="Florenciella parvula, Strain CCMP2471" /LENGTH=1214 /DNA_ID=CAMNT_0007515847 /DNA_START=245 /DNA_END=3889 /DNA_ORIENTATION=+